MSQFHFAVYLFALAGLAALLLYVVVSDLRTRRIPNGTVLAIAALAIPYWWARGIDGAGVLEQAAVLAGAGLVFGLIWQDGHWRGRRYLGGGDLKLYLALALWLPARPYLEMLVWMSLAGVVLSLVILILRRRGGQAGPARVPYGVAIAGGVFAVFGELIVKHFPA